MRVPNSLDKSASIISQADLFGKWFGGGHRQFLILGVEKIYFEMVSFSEFERPAKFIFALEFGNMDKTGDALLDRDERAVLIVLDDHPFYFVVLF